MKNTKNYKSADIHPFTPTSLFDSILANESQMHIDAECQKFGGRVGVILKVLYNRDMSTLRIKFEDELSALLQSICKDIDNELSATKED